MNSIATTPGALRILAGSVIARLPLTMIGIGLLIHVQHLTGSFADAGIVDGAYGLALGFGGPPLGRLADRRGQTGVLVATSVASGVLLVGLALLPVGVPVLCQVALAAALGLATPPVGACLRALLPDVLTDPAALHASFAVDATAVELTWVAGPPLALALGSLVSSGFALAATGVVILAATAAFAAEPASRSWRPVRGGEVARGGALRSPALRVLVVTLVAVGVLFGAVEVGIAAAAKDLGSTASAGPILALWGGGSLLGGAVAARLGGGARTPAGLALVLAALAGGHLLLVPAVRQPARDRRRGRAGRRRDRADLRRRLRHGRPGRARRHRHRGVRVAGDGGRVRGGGGLGAGGRRRRRGRAGRGVRARGWGGSAGGRRRRGRGSIAEYGRVT